MLLLHGLHRACRLGCMCTALQCHSMKPEDAQCKCHASASLMQHRHRLCCMSSCHIWFIEDNVAAHLLQKWVVRLRPCIFCMLCDGSLGPVCGLISRHLPEHQALYLCGRVSGPPPKPDVW